jgi:uncharacterized membrane protein
MSSVDGRSYNKFFPLLIAPENICDDKVENSWPALEIVHKFLPNKPYIRKDLDHLKDAINIVMQRNGQSKVNLMHLLFTTFYNY